MRTFTEKQIKGSPKKKEKESFLTMIDGLKTTTNTELERNLGRN